MGLEEAEGQERTPEQLVHYFLGLSPDEKVKWMESAIELGGRATACLVLNHEGAEIFARNHTCRGFKEGWDAALAQVQMRYTQAREEQDLMSDEQRKEIR